MAVPSKRFSKNHALTGRGSGFRPHHYSKKSGAAFTIIELLVVIAIIGILSSVVLASISGARRRGRDARRIADIKQLQLALIVYYDFNNQYPTALSLLADAHDIPSVPKDPGSNNQYAYVALQGAATGSGMCASYHLGAKLEVNNVGSAGTPFNDDFDGTSGGTYGTGSSDGPVCTGSSWAGNSDIAAVSGDFNGDNDAVNLIYDMRP